MDNNINECLDRLLELKIQRHTLVNEIETKIEALKLEKSHLTESIDFQIDTLEAEIKPQIIKLGKSVKLKNLNAVYVRRRTWDSDGLLEYAKENPSILQFESISEYVQFRFRA